jgi:predicted heme/steroid binding protein
MKTIYIQENNDLVKKYIANNGAVYDTKDEAVYSDKREKLISSIKEKYNTVFTNGDEVANNIIDGLQRMLECDRRTVLNGFMYLTTERKAKKTSV